MERQIDVRKVGQTIKALRHANGLTQDELAGKVGYAIRTIRRIENEGTDSIATVNYFAEIFMVSATDILNGDVFYF